MRAIGNFLMYILALSISGYAVYVYGVLPLGALVLPEMKASFIAHPAGIYTHAFASVAALALGPFQFSTRLRTRYNALHRWIGRFYLSIGVLVGGLSGLYVAQFAFGGPIARLGFSTLAVCWLYTGLRAYLAVRRGAIDEHRRWLVRNYALTFAAVMLRLYMPIFMLSGVEIAVAYPIIAWLCWLPNLAFAEWLNKRRTSTPTS